MNKKTVDLPGLDGTANGGSIEVNFKTLRLLDSRLESYIYARRAMAKDALDAEEIAQQMKDSQGVRDAREDRIRARSEIAAYISGYKAVKDAQGEMLDDLETAIAWLRDRTPPRDAKFGPISRVISKFTATIPAQNSPVRDYANLHRSEYLTRFTDLASVVRDNRKKSIGKLGNLAPLIKEADALFTLHDAMSTCWADGKDPAKSEAVHTARTAYYKAKSARSKAKRRQRKVSDRQEAAA